MTHRFATNIRRSQLFAFGVLGLIVAGVAAVGAQTGKVVFPEAEGKETFMELCGGCHDVRATVEQRKTPKDWRASVEDMRTKGASTTDDEAKVIATYLTRYFGMVNVNKAGVDDMRAVLGVTDKDAKSIMSYREAHGAFATLDDLKKVDGIDTDALEREKASIVFKGA